jgi:hypothetical protein
MLAFKFNLRHYSMGLFAHVIASGLDAKPKSAHLMSHVKIPTEDRQGLTLVIFSAQLEPFLTHDPP